jgi:ketosteroid isomerase-like protein
LPLLLAALCVLAAGCATPGLDRTDAARLRHLEDRAQVLELMAAYGATLDQRDFAAFGQLFAEDAEYGSGPGAPTRGRAAIQSQLEGMIGSNPSNLPAPNFHLFFNPSIQIEGDQATAYSLGAYTAPDSVSGTTRMVFFVAYQDTFVREDGRWLFRKRLVGSGAAPVPTN